MVGKYKVSDNNLISTYLHLNTVYNTVTISCVLLIINTLLLIDVVFRRNTTVLVPNNLNLKH